MQTPSKSEEQELRKLKRSARKLEQTARKMEQELADTQDLIAVRSILGRQRIEKKVNKDTRLVKKLFRKTQKPRVLKPEVERRLKHRVAVISSGGQNVEDENGFQKVG